jgi:hypothetical protein
VSRYNVDRSRELITGYKVGWEHWRSVAVQTVSKPEICHGAGFKLRADARVRVQEPLQICLEGRSKAKTVTSLLNIPSVLCVAFYFFVKVVLSPLVTDTGSIDKCVSSSIIHVWRVRPL